MGVEIVKVPTDWHHPVDETGNFVVGAHHEPLYYLDAGVRTAFQLYENVTEGSPISPVFDDITDLQKWLKRNGWSDVKVEFLLTYGHAPSVVIRQTCSGPS